MPDPESQCLSAGARALTKGGRWAQPTQVQDGSEVREGFLEEEMSEVSPNAHAEVNKAGRKESVGRGNCPCKGSEERRYACLQMVQL